MVARLTVTQEPPRGSQEEGQELSCTPISLRQLGGRVHSSITVLKVAAVAHLPVTSTARDVQPSSVHRQSVSPWQFNMLCIPSLGLPLTRCVSHYLSPSATRTYIQLPPLASPSHLRLFHIMICCKPITVVCSSLRLWKGGTAARPCVVILSDLVVVLSDPPCCPTLFLLSDPCGCVVRPCGCVVRPARFRCPTLWHCCPTLWLRCPTLCGFVVRPVWFRCPTRVVSLSDPVVLSFDIVRLLRCPTLWCCCPTRVVLLFDLVVLLSETVVSLSDFVADLSDLVVLQ